MGREKLNDSQGGEEKRFPRINVDVRLQIKANDKGVVAFNSWDGENKVNKFSTSPITGIFIGAVNKLECFDQYHGNKGGSWKSTYFMANKDNIVVFDPSGNKQFAGDRESLNAWANTKGLEKFKSKKILIILTEDGRVFEISTSMILFIEQIKQFETKTFTNFLIKLTPSVFDTTINDIGITKRGIEFLGPFAATNKPKYAKIEKGADLTDTIWDAYGADEAADMFIAWKNVVSDGGIDTDNPDKAHNDTPPDNIPNDGYVKNSEAQKNNDVAGMPDDESDDLPY